MAHSHDDLTPAKESQGIERLLEELHALVKRDAPALLSLYDVFAQEARFARQWLHGSLRGLQRGDAILEVGAGLMLVSCQLVKEGYRVSALEPVGEGFSDFLELQQLVLGYAGSNGISPVVLEIPIERLEQLGVFSFAFSVNVMEHVDSVPLALDRIGRALRPGASYRFTCPNYLFPYEPHFNIPTLFSKTLTGKVFHKRIFMSTQVADQLGVWRSLNWISVLQVSSACRKLPELTIKFDRLALGRTFVRLVSDPVFAGRRSPWVQSLRPGWSGFDCIISLVFFPRYSSR